MPNCLICQTDKHSSEFFAPLARITICKECTGHNKKNVNNLIMRDEIASNKEIMRQKIDAELLAKTPLFYQDLAEKLGTTENAIENRAAVLRKEGKIGYRSTANKNKGKRYKIGRPKKFSRKQINEIIRNFSGYRGELSKISKTLNISQPTLRIILKSEYWNK